MARMYRVRVASSGWPGGPGLNTFYFQGRSDPSTASSGVAHDVYTLVHGGFAGSGLWAPSLSTFVVDPVVDIIDAATGALEDSYAVTPTTDAVGGGAASYGPTEAMLCVSLMTSDIVNSHRVRGRDFLGPCVAGNDANGSPNSTVLASANALVNGFVTTTTPDVDLVVWHRPVSKTGGSSHVVTSHHVADKWAVLRSRRD